ncbi:hypothetical protein U9M48_005300, partial [Paspalum notatum var. saurae]
MADDEGCHQHKSHHFLVVAYGIQSHVNPARVLAHRLTQLGVDGSVSVSVLATLSVPVAAHRRMFPYVDGDMETTDGVISYVPHSDGLDDGSMPKDPEDRARRRRASSESLSTVVARLADRGRPVTCIISTMVLPPVLDVAREHGIPLAIYWIQPATVLTVGYHYFHRYGEVIAAHAVDPAYEVCLPGLCRPLLIGSFPSFLVDTSGSEMSKAINELFRELFEYIDQWRPKVLVNTFNELEENAVIEMKQHMDIFLVGPMVGSSKEERIHLFKHDDAGKKRYMEWLGAQQEKSVVYVSFGSITKQKKKQMEEIIRGLQQCGRPYLLVLRKDGLEDNDDNNNDDNHSLENNAHSQGMVVDWCNQLDVLSHPAVGCFVSHCGWNSTIEAMASGVPVIGVPNMFDQPTNAHLVEEEWGVGVRGESNSDGVLTGAELARCIGLVMDEGEKAMAIRERARALKELAQAAGNIGGSSERDLFDFVKTIKAHDTVSMNMSITLLSMADDEGRRQHSSIHHFLVVAYGAQGHVNPLRALAHRLMQLGVVDGSAALATLSVPVATHHRMFPSLDGDDTDTTDGVISYVPHSDGVDDGSLDAMDAEDRARRRRASSESLSAIVARLADRGRPVTYIVCGMVLSHVLDVAREHSIPLAIYWFQPATVLAVSYHYFHGYDELINSHAMDPAYEVCLPGMSRPLRIGSFPAFLTDTSGTEMAEAIYDMFREFFEYIDQWRPKVLVNTFYELEENALIEMKQHLDMFVIGPMVVGSSEEERIHMFQHDDAEKKRYMEWLGAQEEESVVYVSFGSISKLTKKQMDEIFRGLQQCGRPYLLVLRSDGLEDDDDDSHSWQNSANIQGMVVGWCNQLEVLSHPAVGCFVSHCGWNSTMEAVASGVPRRFDQPTNVYLVEQEWGIGVRGEHNSDGVLTGAELARCIGLVMDDEGEKAMAIREKARALKELAQEAGRSSERELLDFVETIRAHGAQSHVNPGRVLAHRLTHLGLGTGAGSVLATLSLPIPTHRRMFPSSSPDDDDTEETTDGVVSYAPYSDGVDDGSMPRGAEDGARRRRASSASLSALVARLAARGRRPVSCVVCTMVLPAALDVARAHGLPLAVYWIQSATVLGVTYHYFRGHGELIAARAAAGPDAEVSLPGLGHRPLRTRDLPTFYADAAGSELSKAINAMSRELFGEKTSSDDDGQRRRIMVLVNTFRELEPDVLAEMARRMDVFAVGPMVGSPAEERIHLFQHDKKRYTGWLGAQLEGSVVYVSFGSLSRHAKRQMEEVARGLLQCARPFLLVVRRDGLQDDGDGDGGAIASIQCLENQQGIVVDWCDQLEVLSHPAVGCFVSHCGWNSTVEAVAAGVPVVSVLNTLDQTTNAYLVEEAWGVGVRAEMNGDGVLTGVELERNVELVMGRGARAMDIRERAMALKEMARQAAGSGGAAERNLQQFLNAVAQPCGPRGSVSSE